MSWQWAGQGELVQLPAGEKRLAGQGWAQGRGLGGGGAVPLLRPSPEAPDAAMGSVCVQGDQDTGRADGMSLLAGPGGGMGSVWGGHSGNLGCLQGQAASPSICSPALLPRAAWTSHGSPDSCGHVTQMYTRPGPVDM